MTPPNSTTQASLPPKNQEPVITNISGTNRERNMLLFKVMLGTLLLCVGFANIYNLIDWVQEYDQVVVFFIFFLYMSVAGMLFWGGVKGLGERIKSVRSDS